MLILQRAGKRPSHRANKSLGLLASDPRAGSTWVETSKTLLQNDKLVALHTALAATTDLFFLSFLAAAIATAIVTQTLLEKRNIRVEAMGSSMQGKRRAPCLL